LLDFVYCWHFIFNNFFPRKSCLLWDNVEKYCRTEHATDDNMVHAHCMLDTYGYTFRICNTNWFSTAIMITQTRLDVKLYVHFLSCLFLGAFAKLQKATIRFVMSVRLSVRMEKPGSNWKDCPKIWYLVIFWKCQQIQISL
jgi:hypothetical protein